VLLNIALSIYVANPGNEENFELQLDKSINELPN